MEQHEALAYINDSLPSDWLEMEDRVKDILEIPLVVDSVESGCIELVLQQLSMNRCNRVPGLMSRASMVNQQRCLDQMWALANDYVNGLYELQDSMVEGLEKECVWLVCKQSMANAMNNDALCV